MIYDGRILLYSLGNINDFLRDNPEIDDITDDYFDDFLDFEYWELLALDILTDFFSFYGKAALIDKAPFFYALKEQEEALGLCLTPTDAEELKMNLRPFYEALRHINRELVRKPYDQWTTSDLEILGHIPDIQPLFYRDVTLGLSEDGEEYLSYMEGVLFEMLKKPTKDFLLTDLFTLQALLVCFDYVMLEEITHTPPVIIPKFDMVNITPLIRRSTKKAALYTELIS